MAVFKRPGSWSWEVTFALSAGNVVLGGRRASGRGGHGVSVGPRVVDGPAGALVERALVALLCGIKKKEK